VTFLMKGAASWQALYQLTCARCEPDGRNFMFTTRSSVLDQCWGTKPTVYPLPTPFPTPSPTPAGVACDPVYTDGTAVPVPDLAFDRAELVENNLGGLGPVTTDPPLMRFKNMGDVSGTTVDLVVQVDTDSKNPYRPANVTSNGIRLGKDPEGNQLIDTRGGNMAQINLGVNQPSNPRRYQVEEVLLNFTFVETGTMTPVFVPAFYVSYLDLDGTAKVKEWLTVYGVAREIWDKSSPRDIGVYPRTNRISRKRDEMHVRAIREGFGCDDPDDPMDLAETCGVMQRHRTVTFLMNGASSWKALYQLTCACCEPDGRNFLFAMKSAVIDQCWNTNPTKYPLPK